MVTFAIFIPYQRRNYRRSVLTASFSSVSISQRQRAVGSTKDASMSSTTSTSSVSSSSKESTASSNSWKPDQAASSLDSDHCAKCGNPFGDVAKLAAGKLYHAECFTCTSCCDNKMTKFMIHEGKPYCPLCVWTMIEPQCAECGTWLFGKRSGKRPPVYALGHLYHANCFQCSTCERRIIGKFYISELDKIYCPEHPPEGTSDEVRKLCESIHPPEDASEFIQDDSQCIS